VKEGKAAVH